MRAFLASSISVACTAALVLPVLALESGTAAAAAASGLPLPEPPGSTQSLPLSRLPVVERVGGTVEAQGLAPRDVRPFSLLGVVWDDPDAVLHGAVQVRTRAVGSTSWTGWQALEADDHQHGADPDSVERAGSGRVHGATAPLWVGASDGVEVRVVSERIAEGAADGAEAVPGAGADAGAVARVPGDKALGLPSGLRVELVDPGQGPETAAARRTQGAGGAVGAAPAAGAVGPAPEDGTVPATRPGSHAAQPGNPATRPGNPPAAATLPETPIESLMDPLAGEEETATPGQQAAAEAAVLAAMSPEAAAATAVNADLAPLGADLIPALAKEESESEAGPDGAAGTLEDASALKTYIGPRPAIVTRKGWGADESLREKQFIYSKTVKAAFVHHTATGNTYACSQAPSVIRGIYRYHVVSSGWRDIGYNFVIDRCGNIYEGRAGGVTKAVMGAHTLGFNTDSMGIAVIGTFSSAQPATAAVNAIARLTAWKLGLFGVNPKATTLLTSGGGNKFPKGTKAKLNVISGHRDGFATDCPGARLYSKLATARSAAAKLQGR
ncbi:peptidoglycan recognition protein [Streptomyces sp. NPDC127084]|uniref:peptidoglycan recognition protein family protein n=1 Tax=Streptomyces sp. NPDC127084 TaxID=3347133 RepID=UPI00365D62FF